MHKARLELLRGFYDSNDFTREEIERNYGEIRSINIRRRSIFDANRIVIGFLTTCVLFFGIMEHAFKAESTLRKFSSESQFMILMGIVYCFFLISYLLSGLLFTILTSEQLLEDLHSELLYPRLEYSAGRQPKISVQLAEDSREKFGSTGWLTAVGLVVTLVLGLIGFKYQRDNAIFETDAFFRVKRDSDPKDYGTTNLTLENIGSEKISNLAVGSSVMLEVCWSGLEENASKNYKYIVLDQYFSSATEKRDKSSLRLKGAKSNDSVATMLFIELQDAIHSLRMSSCSRVRALFHVSYNDFLGNPKEKYFTAYIGGNDHVLDYKIRDKEYVDYFMKEWSKASDKNIFIPMDNVDTNLVRLSKPRLNYHELLSLILVDEERKFTEFNDLRTGLKGRIKYDFSRSPLE